MRKRLLAVFAVLGISGGVALASMQAPRWGRGIRLKEELGLTDAQTTQLEKLRSDTAKARIRKHADVRIARLELRDLVEAPTVDDKAISAKVKEVADLEAAALRARVDARLALRKLLTPEQQQKLVELRHRQPHPRGPRPDRRGPDRRGPGRPGPGAVDEDGNGADGAVDGDPR